MNDINKKKLKLEQYKYQLQHLNISNIDEGFNQNQIYKNADSYCNFVLFPMIQIIDNLNYGY